MSNIPTKTKKSSSPPIPTFEAQSELARYVDPDELKKGGRVSSAAFFPNPGDKYLSVNSLEIESAEDIANYYRDRFKKGPGKVAVACGKIFDYNSAAKKADIMIRFDGLNNKWEYCADASYKDAYRHRPVPKPIPSYSHCGVEYLGETLSDLKIRSIARRLALAHKRPHLFES